MTNELENRIGSLLTRKADQIDSRPGKDELATNAYQKGRQMRTRRRVMSGLAGLTVLAVAVPVGLNLLGPNEVRVVPAESATPRPTQTLPAKQSSVEIDLAKLAKGARPDIPWYADGAIHDGDRTIPVDAPSNAPVQFYSVANGYVVQVGGQVRLLDANGREVAGISQSGGKLPIVSGDGRRLAGVAGRTATVLDAATGEVLHSLRLEGKTPPGVVGFLDGTVLLGGTAVGQPGELWNPETGEVSPVRVGGLSKLSGRTDGKNRLVTPISGTCYGIFDLPAGQRLWQLCDAVNPEFTADGKYLVAEKEGTGPLVMDAATGRRLLQVSGVGLMYFPVPSEPAGTVLFWVPERIPDGRPNLSRGAVVRCTLTGECEIAAEGDPGRSGTALPDRSWLFF